MKDIKAQIAKLEKALRKLDRPPSGPNWVRFIFEDEITTAKAIVRFLKGQPPFNYTPGYRAIRDRIEFGIDLHVAVYVATSKGAPAGRVQNKELVEAFFDYDASRRYSASNPITFDTEYFRVSKSVSVPVAPLSIIRERKQFVPIFLCGWTSNPLLLKQRRLLMTIYEDAFLSLTDFQLAPAEILFFPKEITETGKKVRQAEVWQRGDYDLLSQSELDESLQIFLSASDMARSVISSELAELRVKLNDSVDEAGDAAAPSSHASKR